MTTLYLSYTCISNIKFLNDNLKCKLFHRITNLALSLYINQSKHKSTTQKKKPYHIQASFFFIKSWYTNRSNKSIVHLQSIMIHLWLFIQWQNIYELVIYLLLKKKIAHFYKHVLTKKKPNVTTKALLKFDYVISTLYTWLYSL